jgi:hypothetical protein
MALTNEMKWWAVWWSEKDQCKAERERGQRVSEVRKGFLRSTTLRLYRRRNWWAAANR